MPTSPPSPCTATPLCPHTRPCPEHHTERAATAARGYGGRHQAIAAQLRRRHPTGPCGRCGKPGSWTDPRDPLTAGHLDHDGATAVGNYQPEHRSCGNRELAARRRTARGPGGGLTPQT